jgi:predicted dehydrogenase
MLPLRVGLVGCGNISGIYLKNLSQFPETQFVAVADLDPNRAEAAAKEHGIPLALSPEELLNHPDVELVLNLTVPKAHYQVSLDAVMAGKHVYNEKPLCSKRSQARQLLAAAEKKGVLVGGAPDTFYGGAHQTARRLLDEGAIGRVVAGQAFMMCHGHESWHPSPEFYYEEGGGPMLDMGPYYLTALVNMLGPVRRVTAITSRSFPTRTITSEPKKGKVVDVEAYTHYSGVLEFHSGAVVEVTTSFDIWGHKMPPISLYGSEGSMLVPDPNGFGGDVTTALGGSWEFSPNPVEGFLENGRGLGVRDMAYAARTGSSHRATGELCLHVLDVMEAFVESSEHGAHIFIRTKAKKPEPFAWEV